MTRLTDSGSSRSCSAVEPIRSAKTMVMILRLSEEGPREDEGFDGADVADEVISAPQSPQNFLFAGLSVPHCGHRFASAAPQSPQNFLPLGFSDWHTAQRIGSDCTQLRRIGSMPRSCPRRYGLVQ